MELVKKALEFQNPERVPRGELWINSEIFQKAQLEDSLDGHLSLRNRLGMDFLFLPVSATESYNLCQGYRYFSVKDVQKAVKLSNLFVAVIVDGPFQKLVEKKGLIPVLGALKKDKKKFVEEYQRETENVRKLLTPCLGLGVEAFVIADDLAYEHSSYFSPKDAEEFLVPSYSELIESIHGGSAYALFHSCGNISGLISQLIKCGIDGMAACQSEHLDLISLRKDYKPHLIWLGGIEPEHLESSSLSLSQRREFALHVREISRQGGVVLCSSCGMYRSTFLERIPELYQLAEGSIGT